MDCFLAFWLRSSVKINGCIICILSHMCASCPLRPEEDIVYPKLKLYTVVKCLQVLGIKVKSPERAASVLTAALSLALSCFRRVIYHQQSWSVLQFTSTSTWLAKQKPESALFFTLWSFGKFKSSIIIKQQPTPGTLGSCHTEIFQIYIFYPQ